MNDQTWIDATLPPTAASAVPSSEAGQATLLLESKPPAPPERPPSIIRPPLQSTVQASGPVFEPGSGPDRSPRSRPGWRMVASFVAGAILSAGSFSLGASLAFDDGDATIGASGTAQEASIESVPQTAAGTPADRTSPLDGGSPSPAIESDTIGGQPVAIVAAALGPSVVQVETNRGLGSGVIYADGLIITNQHVIDGASDVRIRTSDGRSFEARVVGSDARNDIAVLNIGENTGLPVARLALDQPLAVGELTVAIGSPFQLQQTVTAGIVSAINRPVPNATGGMGAMIQTDAPINPGNSGGALANADGEVIGINASIRTDGSSNSNVGIGFAIPIDRAVDVAERLVSGAPLDVGVLGVQAAAGSDSEVGVVIGEVTAAGAAANAGLQTGDRVLTVDGAPVTDFTTLVGLVQSHFGGDTLDLLVVRDGQTLTLTPTLD